MKDIFAKEAERSNDFLNYLMRHIDHPYILLFTILGILGALAVGSLIWLSREMLKDEAERSAETGKESKKNE